MMKDLRRNFHGTMENVFSKLCDSEYPEKELAVKIKSSRERMMASANRFLKYAQKIEEPNRNEAYLKPEKLIKEADDELRRKRDEALKQQLAEGNGYESAFHFRFSG